MGCIIDRGRAIALRDLVAIVSIRQRGARSRLVLTDNSLYQTLTRPKTFIRCVAAAAGPVAEVGAKTKRVYYYRGAR